MDCAEYERWLQRRLDGEVEDELAALETHLTSCAVCRTREGAVRQLQRGLWAISAAVPPPDLSRRIVAQILEDHAEGARARRRTWRLAALAASLALALVAHYFSLTRHSPPRQNGMPGDTFAEGPGPLTPSGSSAPSLDQSIADAGTALTGLMNITADKTVGQGRLLLPEAIPTPTVAKVDAWPASLDDPARSLLEAGHGMTTGLEPVANSARRAVSLFMRDLPPMDLRN